MFRPRVIPVLLMKDGGLIKTINFKKERYIGDPINAVKLFNDLKADELVFLDINASKEGRTIDKVFVEEVGEEAKMPFAVGGGIKTIKQIKELIGAGAEKVIINSSAGIAPEFIKKASLEFGSSTIVVCIDVVKNIFGKYKVKLPSSQKPVEINPIVYAKYIEEMGAGELIVQSVDNDGIMEGYDLKLLKSITTKLRIPVVALGGAGSLHDFKDAINKSFCSAVAAGSFFIYYGSRRGILINYPTKDEKQILNYE